MSTTLLDRDDIVVRQRRKLFELVNQFDLLDLANQPAGSGVQVGQSPLALVARVFSDLDVALPLTLEVCEPDGTPVLVLHKPWFRMAVAVRRPDGTAVGVVRKELRLGRARLALEDPAGVPLGMAQAENWRAKDFSVRNEAGLEVGRVAKQWRGLATELLTDADTYVVHVSPAAQGALRSLMLASCLVVDSVMKQKDAG